MTSKFSIDNRELLQRISSGEAVVGIDFGNLIVRELAAFRLAAMDSEPVAWLRNPDQGFHLPMLRLGSKDPNPNFVNEEFYPVYAAPQPDPVVPEEMTPEMMRYVQLNSELGAYAASNLSGAYDLFAEFWKVACRAAMLAAAPQSPDSEPATVPGKWIPVSERMPENDGAYLCWDNRYVTTYAFIFGAWQANQFVAKNITHWMPLPNPPKE